VASGEVAAEGADAVAAVESGEVAAVASGEVAAEGADAVATPPPSRVQGPGPRAQGPEDADAVATPPPSPPLPPHGDDHTETTHGSVVGAVEEASAAAAEARRAVEGLLGEQGPGSSEQGAWASAEAMALAQAQMEAAAEVVQLAQMVAMAESSGAPSSMNDMAMETNQEMQLVMDKIKIGRVVARMRIRPVVLAFEAWKELVEEVKLERAGGGVEAADADTSLMVGDAMGN